MKPTKEMGDALSGAVSPDDISPAALSALRLPVYSIAIQVLGLYDNERKRKSIERHPAGIQPLIRAECRRLYDQRRKR